MANDTPNLNLLSSSASAALAEAVARAGGARSPTEPDEETVAPVVGASSPSVGALTPVSTTDAYVISGVDAALAVRLINFKTGSYELLPSHKEWLATYLPGALSGRTSAWFDVLGFASRSGTVSYNQTLSEQRAAYVAGFLSQYLDPSKMNVLYGLGESGSWHQDDNAGYDRAVEVYVFGYKPSPTATPGAVIRPAWRSFKVRMVAARSAGIDDITNLDIPGFSLTGCVLEFYDVARKRSKYFVYAGAGLSLPELASSFEGTGPWSTFKLYGYGKERLEDFAGPASLYQGPGLALGANIVGGDYYLAIDSPTLVKNGTLRKPRLITLEGGPGIGAGLGMFTVGTLTMIP